MLSDGRFFLTLLLFLPNIVPITWKFNWFVKNRTSKKIYDNLSFDWAEHYKIRDQDKKVEYSAN